MSTIALTWKQVWAWRLSRHFLLNRAVYEDLVGVVSAVCGIQAQVISAAELSIGMRVDAVTRRDVQDALWERRVLVKTFGIRGTVHLFPSDELPLWTAALRARTTFDEKRQQQFGLEPGQLKALVEAIGDALDGQQLTTQELGEQVVQRAGPWAGEKTAAVWGGAWPRWRIALGEAALSGLLCYGPPRGSEVTFVRPDQWTGHMLVDGREADQSEALAEVFRRYLRAYGPATTRHFAQWFSIPPRLARDLATQCGKELVEVDVEGYCGYLLERDVEDFTNAGSELPEQLPARLLPHFDCYAIGCHPRDRLLPPEWATRVPPRTTPSQLPVLLVDGKVAGVWEKQKKGDGIEVRVEPFGKLGKRQQTLLEDEAGRIGAILEQKADLTIGPVSIRPHL